MINSNPDLLWLALATLVLPFTSFFISILFPQRYSWVAPIIATLLLLASMISSFVLLGKVWNEKAVIFEYPWFSVASHSVNFTISLNNSSALMVLAVSVIAFLVHLYSVGFMAGDAHVSRYFALLGLFTFSMLGLVMSGNLLVTFLFWELVGATSYLLIGFWMEKPRAAAAATKAFLINRLGDIGLLSGILLIWVHCGTVDLQILPAAMKTVSASVMTMATACVLLGVMSKSAQFPLFTWLPDAMEGPTPVSALIHAATMVAAGIYLVGRIHFLFTPYTLLAMSIVGAVTALLGATLALIHYDIKKILAYSTISQLGWMVLTMGAGDPSSSQLHLLTHAFFKAGLFLSAGAVLHILHQASSQKHLLGDIQDIRQLGGLARRMPFVFLTFGLTAASLAGIPLFSGFLSKDGMLSSLHPTVYVVVGLFITSLTVAYTVRLVWFTFLAEPKIAKELDDHPFAAVPWVMRVPMLVLAIGSTWIIVSANPVDAFGWWYRADPNQVYHPITVLSMVVVLFSAGIAFALVRNRKIPRQSRLLTSIARNFGIDELIQQGIVTPSIRIAQFTSWMDTKCIDGFLHVGAYAHVGTGHLIAWLDKTIVDGLTDLAGTIVHRIGNIIRTLINGKIQSYLIGALVWLIVFILWISFKS